MITYLQTEKRAWNFFVFGVSFAFSLLSCLINSRVPVEQITHSQILVVGVQWITRMVLISALALKVANIADRKKFYSVLSKLQWGNINVRKVNFLYLMQNLNCYYSLNGREFHRRANPNFISQLRFCQLTC